MVKYVIAAMMGILSGITMLVVTRGDPVIPSAVGLIVMCVFFTETTIMEKLREFEAKMGK